MSSSSANGDRALPLRRNRWAILTGAAMTTAATLGLAAGCGGKPKTPSAAARPGPVAGEVVEGPVERLNGASEPAPARAAAAPADQGPPPDPAPAKPKSADVLAAEVARLAEELGQHGYTIHKAGAGAGQASAAPPPQNGAGVAEPQPAGPSPAAAPGPVATPPALPETEAPPPGVPAANEAPSAPPAGANVPLSIEEWAAQQQEGSPPLAAAAPPAAQGGAATPLAQGSPAADALARRLEQRVADDPRDVAAQLEYQIYKFLLNESVPDLAALAKLPQEDREVLTALLDGLSNFRSTLRAGGNLLLSDKVRPLLDLSNRLRTQSELTIATMALCRRVERFGVYDPIEPARFEPVYRDARRGVVGPEFIVYCEVQNFASLQGPGGMWETKLAQETALYTEEKGRLMWESGRRLMADQSRNRRHDFYTPTLVSLPPSLPIDRYILKVTIVDEQSNRVAEATMPIDLVAKAPAAPAPLPATANRAPAPATTRPVAAPPVVTTPQQHLPPGVTVPGVPGPATRPVFPSVRLDGDR